jgi:hypothetical protein
VAPVHGGNPSRRSSWSSVRSATRHSVLVK